MKVVAFLQNPWSPHYAGHPWPRASWLKAFHASVSGRRLKRMESPGIEYYYENASPVVADNPRTIYPADINHMRTVLLAQDPDYIITFGSHAANGISKLRGEFPQPVMMLPHPAYRYVTNEMYEIALRHLNEGFKGVLALQVPRGRRGNGGILIIRTEPSKHSK